MRKYKIGEDKKMDAGRRGIGANRRNRRKGGVGRQERRSSGHKYEKEEKMSPTSLHADNKTPRVPACIANRRARSA